MEINSDKSAISAAAQGLAQGWRNIDVFDIGVDAVSAPGTVSTAVQLFIDYQPFKDHGPHFPKFANRTTMCKVFRLAGVELVSHPSTFKAVGIALGQMFCARNYYLTPHFYYIN